MNAIGTQAARSARTRAKLVRAARRLFAKRGFAAVGTSEIVRAAGVTRGALYHHFADKEDLFLAVYEAVEADLTARIAQSLADGDGSDTLERGIVAFLDECRLPEVQRIVLIDGPAVLGWTRWREVAARHGLALIEAALGFEIDSGRIAALPLRPLAHVMMGALDEAALLVATDAASRDEVSGVLLRMLSGLRPH